MNRLTRRVLPLTLSLILLLSLLCSGCSYRSKKAGTAAAPSSSSSPFSVFPGFSAPVQQGTQTPGEAGLSPAETARRLLVTYETEAGTYQAADRTTQLMEYRCTALRVEIPGMKAQEKAVNARLQELTELYENGSGREGDLYRGRTALLTEASEQLASNAESFVPYAMTRDVSVARGDAAVFSLLFDDYIAAGGAHGIPNRIGVTFDVATGRQLDFADLAEDAESLRALCLQQLLDQTAAMDQDSFFEGYEESLPWLMDDNCWYFSSRGLVFYANPYTIAPYAAGRLEFTVPYKTLSDVLHERYQVPAREAVQGGINGSLASRQSLAGAKALLELSLSAVGETVVLWAENTVYDVRLCRADYAEYTDEFAASGELCYVSRMDDGEFLRVRYDFPDTVPNLMVSWRLPDGTRQNYLLSLSGEDGSLLLTDPHLLTLAPDEITHLLPYSFDFNGDDWVETVTLTAAEADARGRSVYTLTITGDSTASAFSTAALDNVQLWAADMDEDGVRELILCGQDGDDQYGVWFWRFNGLPSPAYIQGYVGQGYPARLLRAGTGLLTVQENVGGRVRDLTPQWSRDAGVWLLP